MKEQCCDYVSQMWKLDQRTIKGFKGLWHKLENLFIYLQLTLTLNYND